MAESNSTEPLSSEKSTRRRVRRQQKKDNPIETANWLSNEDFVLQYIRPSSDDGWPLWKHPRTETVYNLKLVQPADMVDVELEACFNLVVETSGEHYRGSSAGWHPAAKKKEMRSPDLRYILVKNADGVLMGFTSMMPTFENHEPVIYCYEIHLKPELQGTRLGQHLMGCLTKAAENIPTIEKVMLTCFVSNASGLKFYEKIGFIEDDFSPRERKLRGGKVVKPDYVILSRRTRGRAGDGDHGMTTEGMKVGILR